jgi:hypothetical protein
MSILEVYCSVDDFWQQFAPQWHTQLVASGRRQRDREANLSPSEIMTLLIWFHHSRYRSFKDFYTRYARVHLRREFPNLLSYSRIVTWMPAMLVPLWAYLHTLQGQETGISFIDSTKLRVCANQRIHSHKVFAEQAKRGKTSTGWFCGFKLHLVVSDQGELLAWCLTPGNVDDRQPVPTLVRHLIGKLFGDKGYVSAALAQQLRAVGIELVTKIRKNMANHLMELTDKVLLRKRAIIETIIDQLKNISQIEHSRHRSPLNFLVNLVCGLIAYCHQEHKPSLHLTWHLLSAA